MNEWRLAEAKNRFSEVVNQALVAGPQIVRRREDTVIVISEAEYLQLIGNKLSFKDYLLHPPHSLVEIELSRDSSPMRTLEL